MEQKQDTTNKQKQFDKWMRRIVDDAVGILSIYLALKITGTYAIVDTFLNAHQYSLLKAFLVFVLLDIVLTLAGAVVKGALSGVDGEWPKLSLIVRLVWALVMRRLKGANHPSA